MPQGSLTRYDLYRAILFATGIYLALTFIRQIADVLLIFSLTLIVVINLDPAVSWLHRKRIPRQVSAGALAVVTLGLFGLTMYLIIPPAISQFQELIADLPGYIKNAESWFSHLAARFSIVGGMLPRKLDLDVNTLKQLGGPLLGGVTRFTQSLVGIVTGTFLIFVSTVYTLANPQPLAVGFLRAIGREYRDRVVHAGHRLSVQIIAWGRGVLIAMFAIFLLSWIALSIIGIKQAFLFAVIAGLFEAVPIIGPIIGAIPPSVVSLLQDPSLTIWVIVSFIVIQQIENHLLIPLLMSHQLSLHPVTIIFSVLVMGGLFGLIGIFLATPAAAAAGIIYEELYLCGREERCDNQAQEGEEPDAGDSS